MGTPAFAVPSLRAIVKAGYDVAAVVTNQDEPQGRGLKVIPPAVKTAALELGLPIIQVGSLKDAEFVTRLAAISPDLMVVVAFRILPREVFTIAKLGTFNLHASLLPKYRGAAPINWAIINGERETGVTTFFLDEKVDTGRIILQRKLEIGDDETAGELSNRLSQLGAAAVVDTIKLIQQGNVHIIEQDNSLATKAPKISKEDCLIDWSKPAAKIHNLVRGFSPEPCAYTFLGGKLLKIFKMKMTLEKTDLTAGTIRIDSGRFFVACSDDLVEVLELQLEGKKKLVASDFLRGARIKSGDRLERAR